VGERIDRAGYQKRGETGSHISRQDAKAQRKKMGEGMKLRLTEELWREGNMYVAYCPELDIPSCGNSVEQAKSNLREVIVIHLEEAEKQGRLSEFLQSAGLDEMEGILSSKRELVGFTPIELAV
jgi:predicted RNase H-like HicB family nuclease